MRVYDGIERLGKHFTGMALPEVLLTKCSSLLKYLFVLATRMKKVTYSFLSSKFVNMVAR